MRLHYFKLCGIKIVWILNNKVPHDDNAKWAKRMMQTLIRSSYKVIILCKDSVSVVRNLVKNEKVWKDKIVYMPHPNYIGAYASVSDDVPQKGASEMCHLLFFGSIRPYKNVDVLIKAFKRVKNDKMTLTIAGGCKSATYQKYIEELAADSNITLMLHYIADDEILGLIAQNSLLVFPYDNETTLNSGSIILACSAGKTFIAPNIGTVKDFPDASLFYTYEYKDEAEHEQKLAQMMQRAYADFCADKDSFLKKGETLYEYIQSHHSTEKLAEIWKEMLVL